MTARSFTEAFAAAAELEPGTDEELAKWEAWAERQEETAFMRLGSTGEPPHPVRRLVAEIRQLRSSIRWAVTLESQNAELVAAIGEIHRPRTFEARSDHHHSEALAAVGSITPRPHDCSAACFEWVTICDGDGTEWPCSTAAVAAALTGSTE